MSFCGESDITHHLKYFIFQMFTAIIDINIKIVFMMVIYHIFNWYEFMKPVLFMYHINIRYHAIVLII